MRIFRRLLGLVLLAISLGGSLSQARADGLDDIVKRGTLRIAVAEFTPWTFTNRTKQLEGFEIDVGRQLALDLGVTPEFKVYAWDRIVDGVARGEVDVVAAGLAITPARALKVAFSNPYTSSGATLVVSRALVANIASPEMLNKPEFKIVAVNDTLEADVARMLFDFTDLKTLPDAERALAELLEGRAHAYVTSVPEAAVMVKRHPDQIALLGAEPLVKSVSGFAVARQNYSLLNYLNAWIASRGADGWISGTYDYWFTGFDWLADVKK